MIVLAAVPLCSALPAAAQAPALPEDAAFAPGQLLVQFEPGTSKAESRELAEELEARVLDRVEIVPNLALVDLPAGLGVKRADRLFGSLDEVKRAQPNFVYRVALDPDDTEFVNGQLWGLHNPGGAPFFGVPDADIDAPEAWGLVTGSSTVTVAVIDSGIASGHPDLAGNLWQNPPEVGGLAGFDDDGNGKIDDRSGWDFVEDDNTPDDANSHGTHVGGVIGAVGNNGTGVTGVNWDVGLMALKAGTADGSLFSSDVLLAIQYAEGEGADIVNASFTGTGFDPMQRDAIAAASGVLFVAAAGNETNDNDVAPRYPCGYELPNLVCVAATNPLDNLASFSNFGNGSVDLAAPGASTKSTVPTYTDIFFDDVEGPLKWTFGGSPTPWAVTNERAMSPTQSLTDSPGADYQPGADNFARLTTPVSLTDRDACRVSFNAAYQIVSGDSLRVEASTNTVNWTTLRTLSGSKPSFGSETADLLEFSGLGAVYVRFRLQANGDAGTAAGAHIDDVRIQCADPAAATYGFKSGTSMATPHVAGAAALVLDAHSAYTTTQVRSALLNNVDQLSSLSCRVVTGGRLNLRKAVELGDAAPPPPQSCTPAITQQTPPITQQTPHSCVGKQATIVGTNGKDRLTGTKRADVIVGLAGNDTITGRGGNDRLCGGAGKDKLVGGSGKDKLVGGSGKDKLVGGPGKDVLER